MFKSCYFHKYCDDVEDTLVLLRTQYGKTLGGYCHYKWNDQRKDNNGWVSDIDMRAFIFQLDLHQKFVPKISQYLIKYDQSCGPYFRDLSICDDC